MNAMMIDGKRHDLFENNSTAVKSSPVPAIDYVTVGLGDIKLGLTEAKTNQKRRVEEMKICGTKVNCTSRFMTSLCAQAGISQNIFKYFDFEEVTERIVGNNTLDRVRCCLVRRNTKD